MILDTGSKLEAFLAGSVSASQPQIHVTYAPWNPQGVIVKPTTFRVVMTDTTPVTILAAPVTNPTLEILGVDVYNKDSASVTLTIQIDDGTTDWVWVKYALATVKTFQWRKYTGWIVSP